MSDVVKPDTGTRFAMLWRHLVKSIWCHNSVGDH